MSREIHKRYNFNANIDYYEKRLSPFGKKVLYVMVNNWKLECERNKNTLVRQQAIPIHNRKVFNFRNSDDIHSEQLLPQNQNNLENQTKDLSPHNTNPNENVTHKIPKSSELIRTIETNYPNSSNTSVRNNFLNQSNYDSNKVDLNLNINNLFNRNLITPPFETDRKLNTVDWNDMFDVELIVPNVITNETELTKNHNEITNLPTSDEITNEHLTTLVDTKSETHPPKIQTKITDTLCKNQKNGKNKPKKTLRKQKYTKTVSNWLKDIPSNIVEEATNYSKIVTTVEKEKSIKRNTKQVVQSQLANKDGVMRFSKPKNLTDNHTETPLGTVRKDAETCKTKRKTKFVTPVKSRTPVREIVNEICVLDEIDARNAGYLFSGVMQREIYVVLIYRNGFSQLNYQYTDDACVPEGVMLFFDSTFYYYKGVQIDLLNPLMCLLENNEIICYDGKHILMYLMSLSGIEDIQVNIVDLKIGGSLLDPDNPPSNFKELQKLISFDPKYTIETECPLQKCAWYITLLQECAVTLKKLLLQSCLWNIFINIEMCLLPVLAGMEHRGVMVDTEKLKYMEEILLSKIKIVEEECYKAAGKTFQINSSTQVSAVLYDELQLDAKSNVKIRETVSKGAKSTSETMLRSLVSPHPLPKLILEYRRLYKAHSTFVAGIAHYVRDGIVKPTWEQIAAATGRIASNNPNLQAIPKVPFGLDVFPENDTADSPLLNFRSVYIPRDGYSFLAADFKHVECRVFAHAAADTGLLALLTDGQDLFKALAAKWLNKSETDVTSEDRERTKRIVYASLYGAGPRKLMDILGISYEQTLQVITSFNKTFPCLKSFGRSVIYQCERNEGKLSTVCGRVRRFINISSPDYTLKAQAERQAVNFIVQGSAADLCKIAMVGTQKRLKNYHPHLDARLVLQIHDELVWEVKVEHLEKAAVIIKEIMENCGRECGMSMSLPVAISVGSSWGDITELDLLE